MLLLYHFLEGFGETNIHLLYVLSALGFFCIALLLLESLFFVDPPGQHRGSHISELLLFLIRDRLLQVLIFCLVGLSELLDLLFRHFTREHL